MGLFSTIGKIAGGVIGTAVGNPAAGVAIGGALGGVGDSLRGGGDARSAASTAVQQGTPSPYGTYSPYGSVAVDPATRRMTFTQADSPFARLLQSIGLSQYANAATAPGAAYAGASPELVAAAQGFTPQGEAGNFNSELSRLRAIAAPEDRRSFQGLENALFSRGMMGTSGGGERYRAWYEAQNAADLQRQGTAQDFARQRSMDRFNTALQAVGSGQVGAQQQFNQGQSAFSSLQGIFGQLMNQGNVGVAGGGGTPAELAQWNAAQQTMNSPSAILEASGIFNKLGDVAGGLFGRGSVQSPGAVTQQMISGLPDLSNFNWGGG